MSDYKVVYNDWLKSEFLSNDEKQELISIKSDDNEIKERFSGSLNFGTAGMRGVLNMGTNRMNIYTVVRATRGLASYITERGSKDMARGVVIAYDTRRCSAEFAIACAEVLSESGIKVYLYENVRPVPMCSFAIRELNAVSGIMITASHNPKQYNGYKVYGEDGAQMSPEATEIVVKYINSISDYFLMPEKTGLTPSNIRGKNNYFVSNITVIGKDIDEKYYAKISKLLLSSDAVKACKDIKIVYTALHGAGYVPVTTMLSRMGIPVITVPEQSEPDVNFSTVTVPNPEEATALKMAVELAENIGGSIVIGTDPDCDRMGIAIKNDNGKFVLLNGNQIGVLLMDYILLRHKQKGTLPQNSAVVKTIVTTQLANRVAEDYGAKVFDVLTGFKFIGEKIKEWEISGEYTYMFGFEESYGSLCGTHARDKDAVVASMLFAEMACYYESIGSSVYARLQSLYQKYGFYVEKAISFTFGGLDGMEKMKNIMKKICNIRVNEMAGKKVEFISDYNLSKTFYTNGEVKDITLPKTNALYIKMVNGDWICVRPSGTEPKLKLYIASSRKCYECAETANEKYIAEMKKYCE